MELDELKQTWKETTIKKNKNTDIMDLMKHKSYGPIAALKKAYRRQIVLMSLLPFILLLGQIDDLSKPLTSVLFWTYVAFCVAMVIFASYNYRIVSNIEGMDAMVKDNLEQQVNLLDTRMKNMLTGQKVVMLLLIALTEIMPYFQHYRMLDKWHSLNPMIRYGAYGLLLVFQYFVGKWKFKTKFGEHINYLKNLVKEMQYQ